MWHDRHPARRARVFAALQRWGTRVLPGVMALTLAVTSGLASGCGEVTPTQNQNNHNFVPCIEGEARCAGDDVEMCLHGTWQVDQTCEAPDQVCFEGSCVNNTPTQGQTLILQNGLLGYQGCIDTAVPVPEGSGFNEITPQDAMMQLYHWIWTGS